MTFQQCPLLISQILIITGLIFTYTVSFSRAQPTAESNPPNLSIIKNIYVYLDASETIVEKQANSSHLKIKDYLVPLFDPQNDFIGEKDKVHITFFHSELVRGSLSGGIPGNNFSAITDRLETYASLNSLEIEGSKQSWRTNIINVLNDIQLLLEDNKLKSNEFNLFIIASDFIHDPKNNICRMQDVNDITEKIEKLSKRFPEAFTKDSQNVLILIPIPAPERYVQKHPKCMAAQKTRVLGGLKTEFNALEFQINGGLNDAHQLLQSIRKKLAKWIRFKSNKFVANKEGKQDIELLVSNPSVLAVRLEDIDIKLVDTNYHPGLEKNNKPWILESPVNIPASGTVLVNLLSNPDFNSSLKVNKTLYFYPKQNWFPDTEPSGYTIELPEGDLKILESRATLIPGKLKAVEIHTEIHLKGKKFLNDTQEITIRLRDKHREKEYDAFKSSLNITNGGARKTIVFKTDNPDILNRSIDKIIVEAECAALFASSELSAGVTNWFRNYIFTLGFTILGSLLQIVIAFWRYFIASKKKQNKVELMEIFSILMFTGSFVYSILLKSQLAKFVVEIGLIFPALAMAMVISTIFIDRWYARQVDIFIKAPHAQITYEKFTRNHMNKVFRFLIPIAASIYAFLWLTV